MAYRVLVVEDLHTQREAIVALLALEGYDVIEARDGAEGVRRALDGRPDVIVADFRMPRMDAGEMALSIRDGGHAPAIPIVAITSLAAATVRENLADQNLFFIILRKPVNPAELLAEIRAALA